MAPQRRITILQQIVITTGLDADGSPGVWVDCEDGSIIEALGLLRMAEDDLLMRWRSQGGGRGG